MTGLAKAEMVRLAMGLGVVGVTVAGLTAVATGAIYTDSKPVTDNGFVSGTVKLGTSPSSQAFTVPNMAPGDTAFGTITVSNSGTLQERYALSSKVTNLVGTQTPGDTGLATQLKVSAVATSAACNAAAFVAPAQLLVSNASLATSLTTAGALFGSSSQGAQPGDRSLDPNAQETLCFQVTLPLDTGNAFQGKQTAVSFIFDSEQTANN